MTALPVSSPVRALESVTLVIDDGPSPVTPQLLDALENGGHRAVLFLIGSGIAGREATLVDAVRRGFALGNHSFSHPHFSELDVAAAREEIVRTERLIDTIYSRAQVRRPGRWFRFPYLDTGGEKHDEFQRLLAELGFSVPLTLRKRLDADDRQRMDWPSTLVTRDWALPNETDFRETLHSVAANDIVEYHDKVDTVTKLCAPLVDEFSARFVRAVVPSTPVTRVFIVSWWMDRLGGMERHIAELACALVRAGIAVHYFSEMPLPPNNAYRRQMQAHDVHVHSPPQWLWAANMVRRASWRVPGLGRLLAMRKLDGIAQLTQGDLLSAWLAKALEEEAARRAPNVVHVHGIRLGQMWLIEWAKAKGIPSMYTEHVAIQEMGGPWHESLPEIAMRAGVLACVSEHSRASMLEALPRPHPVAITNHIVHSPSPATSERASPFHWLCVARLAHHKGTDVLLEAFARCVRDDARYRLTLAGDGPMQKQFETQAQSLGISGHVDFRGHVSPEEVSELLRTIGQFVLASRTEGLPVSLVEALAHGSAIVATRAGGVPELLSDFKSALLVPTGDAEALAHAMRRISTDDTLRHWLQESAREAFVQSRYHEDSVVEDLVALYLSAAKSS